MTADAIHDEVRTHYAAAATRAADPCCASDAEAGPALYSALELTDFIELGLADVRP